MSDFEYRRNLRTLACDCVDLKWNGGDLDGGNINTTDVVSCLGYAE